MTSTHIAEIALGLSALTAFFSGTTWYLGLQDRRANLILRAKPGNWSRRNNFVLTNTLIVFNPSSRANCIQDYWFRVRVEDGSFRNCKTESMRISSRRFSRGIGDPLPMTSGEAARLIQDQFDRSTEKEKENSESLVQVNPLPLSIPAYSGVEVEVGTLEFDLPITEQPLHVEIELQDIYNRHYRIACSI